MTFEHKVDKLVAEHIFGLKVVKTHYDKKRPKAYYLTVGKPVYYDAQGETLLANELPQYTTDIDAAWTVLETVKITDDEFRLSKYNNVWECTFGHIYGLPRAKGNTAALAICLAALAYNGVYIGSNRD